MNGLIRLVVVIVVVIIVAVVEAAIMGMGIIKWTRDQRVRRLDILGLGFWMLVVGLLRNWPSALK